MLTKMIYKTRNFTRWARKIGLNDSLLGTAVLEIQKGLLEADLGGGIVKKRIALPGREKRGSTRTLLATNRDDRWFFVFGFEKNERANCKTYSVHGSTARQARSSPRTEYQYVTPFTLSLSKGEGDLLQLART